MAEVAAEEVIDGWFTEEPIMGTIGAIVCFLIALLFVEQTIHDNIRPSSWP